MRAEEVSITLKERRKLIILFCCGKRGGANESGDDHRQRRRGIAACFFPSLLTRNWSAMQQKVNGAADHHMRTELSQQTKLVEPLGEECGKCDFVELRPLP